MSNNTFIKKIESFIESKQLLDKGCKYLVALSGGADSVCMLLVLKDLDYNVEAVHCNFHLRGNDSADDENYCMELCEKLNIKLHVEQFDTLSYANTNKISVEMAARELRYTLFDRLLDEYGYAAVCVAHHINDNVETVLLNLARGTGVKGLQGIMPKRGKIIRPMLCVTRTEIEKYMSSQDMTFCHDITNNDDEIIRNGIRHNIIPQLEKVNSAAIANINKTARRMVAVEQILTDFIEDKSKKIIRKNGRHDIINFCDLNNEYLCYLILKKYGFTSLQAENIFEYLKTAKPGRIFNSDKYSLLVDREEIILKSKDDRQEVGITVLEAGEYRISGDETLIFQNLQDNDISSFPHTKDYCFADAGKVRLPLHVRNVRTGDRFIPFGMKNEKLVSDYLTDRKYNVFEKEEQLIVTDETGKSVWLVGERADESIRVTLETKSVILLNIRRL